MAVTFDDPHAAVVAINAELARVQSGWQIVSAWAGSGYTGELELASTRGGEMMRHLFTLYGAPIYENTPARLAEILSDAIAVVNEQCTKPTPPPVAVQRQPFNPVASLLHTLARDITEGRVSVHSGDAEAYDSDVAWADVPGCVSWRTWVGEHLAAFGEHERWLAATADAASIEAHARVVRAAWEATCSGLELPSVLDLRELPTDAASEIPAEPFRAALERAIHRSAKGVALLVAGQPGALARLLPRSAGPNAVP